jgi:hypothetical protein
VKELGGMQYEGRLEPRNHMVCRPLGLAIGPMPDQTVVETRPLLVNAVSRALLAFQHVDICGIMRGRGRQARTGTDEPDCE